MNTSPKLSDAAKNVTTRVNAFVLKLPQGELLHKDYHLRRFSARIIDDGIRTVSDLICLTPEELKRKTGASDKNICRIQNILKNYDLSLR